MKYLFAIPFLIVLSDSQCSKMNSTPTCINAKIEVIKSQPKWNPPAKVSSYEYNGETVYFFTSNCCDQYDEVYDKDCNYICAPSGGLTGKGDGKCSDFSSTAKFIKVIWEDKR